MCEGQRFSFFFFIPCQFSMEAVRLSQNSKIIETRVPLSNTQCVFGFNKSQGNAASSCAAAPELLAFVQTVLHILPPFHPT